MTRDPNTIRQDERGSAVVEFALAIPLFVTMVMGFWQMGLIYWANAGVQNALGEASRYATIYPTPTNDQIEERLKERDFGTHNGTLVSVTSEDSGTNARLVTVRYTQPTDFIFFTGPTVDLSKSKLVYVAEANPPPE